MLRDGQLSRDADGGNPYIYRPLTENDAVNWRGRCHAKGFGFVD